LQEFLESLKEGEFKVPVCTSCNSKAWPAARYCPNCLHETSLQKIETTGTLLEFTSSHLKGSEGFFGVVEMSGIKIVGSIDSLQLREGMKVKMFQCGITPDGTAFYHFTKA
jgi:uncharacterized OB-fold protein